MSIDNLSREDTIKAIEILQEQKKRKKYNHIDSFYPDKGALRRSLYTKHLEFFRAGLDHEERLMLAANRIGKTIAIGAYEVSCHLTGIYPDWWEGRKFNRAIDAWAAGKTGQTVRDIMQKALLGDKTDIGSGLIRKHLIINTIPKHGIPEAVDTIYVKHISGNTSKISFKSYDQKRQSFEGTKKDVIWLDEESDMSIYTECLLRTADTSGKDLGNGLMLLTFTPLLGMSEVVLAFLPNGELLEDYSKQTKYVVSATWDDAPHLTESVKEKLWASIPPFQRDARSKGIPQLGAGAIYPVPESDIFIDDFPLPKHFPKSYALDVGWNKTACVWGALDRESDILYLYSEHYRGEAEPSIHTQSINARGKWIKGVIDPAARGRGQKDGQQLMQNYIDLGLDLDVAFNGVESGIYEVWQRLSTGRLKIFNSLTHLKSEIRLYRRDEKGKIVKANDHLMDCMRYLVMSGIARAQTEPTETEEKQDRYYNEGSNSQGWMS